MLYNKLNKLKEKVYPLKGKKRPEHSAFMKEWWTPERKKEFSKRIGGKNHPRFGKKNSSEHRKKISIANKGKPSPNKGRTDWFKHTNETKRKISESLSGEKHPFYGESLPKYVRKKMKKNHWSTGPNAQKIKNCISATKKRKYSSGETVPWCKGMKIPTGKPSWNSGKTSTDDNRIPSGKSHGMFGQLHTKSACEKMRKISLRRWQENSEYREKVKNGLNKFHNMKPNNSEQQVLGILDEQFPNEWKFCGDWSFWLDGKNPDFVNINGQKKLIEFFGRNWHKDYEEPERIFHFAKFGFQTLIVWEEELQDIDLLTDRIIQFHNGKPCKRVHDASAIIGS